MDSVTHVLITDAPTATSLRSTSALPALLDTLLQVVHALPSVLSNSVLPAPPLIQVNATVAFRDFMLIKAQRSVCPAHLLHDAWSVLPTSLRFASPVLLDFTLTPTRLAQLVLSSAPLAPQPAFARLFSILSDTPLLLSMVNQFSEFATLVASPALRTIPAHAQSASQDFIS